MAGAGWLYYEVDVQIDCDASALADQDLAPTRTEGLPHKSSFASHLVYIVLWMPLRDTV